MAGSPYRGVQPISAWKAITVRPRDVLKPLFAEKAKKYHQYSNGEEMPVWLPRYVWTCVAINRKAVLWIKG